MLKNPNIRIKSEFLATLTRVGMVVDRENCMWASTIFERSGLIWAKKKATLTMNEGRTILRGLAGLRLIGKHI